MRCTAVGTTVHSGGNPGLLSQLGLNFLVQPFGPFGEFAVDFHCGVLERCQIGIGHIHACGLHFLKDFSILLGRKFLAVEACFAAGLMQHLDHIGIERVEIGLPPSQSEVFCR